MTKQERISVMYVYSNAFFRCDCGNDVVALQKFFNSPLYTGDCKCGLKWEIKNGMFRNYCKAAEEKMSMPSLFDLLEEAS